MPWQQVFDFDFVIFYFNALATGRAEDAWTASHWCSSRDLVPVVGGGLRGEYADKMLQDQGNMVYSGYSQANTF